MASGLTFRLLIHVDLVFVYAVRRCPRSVLLPAAVQLSQHHY